eukprot:gb/GEZN01003841.1/.p1 GENE.gb/GEZN01003841.1/~~gb/GEZN01003841.1/.p1  ORF type:complete len:602 (+),score=91.70 gb/GEZN01003841.1/:51-1808(+)
MALDGGGRSLSSPSWSASPSPSPLNLTRLAVGGLGFLLTSGGYLIHTHLFGEERSIQADRETQSGVWNSVRAGPPAMSFVSPPADRWAKPPPLKAELSVAMSSVSQKEKPVVLVIGAGPAGALSAVMLGRAGFRVHVIEKRTLMEIMSRNASRTYPIVLVARALRVLKAAQIPLDPKLFILNGTGVIRHAKGNASEPRSMGSTQIIVSRADLTRTLIKQTALADLDVFWHFGMDPDHMRVDLSQNLLEMDKMRPGNCVDGLGQPCKGDRFELGNQLSYDLLIGADGVHSQIRDVLNRHDPSSFSATLEQDHRWYVPIQEIFIPGGHKKAMHVWYEHEKSDRVSIIAPPNVDGSVSAVFITSEQGYPYSKPILSTANGTVHSSKLRQLLLEKFPDFPVPDNLDEQLKSRSWLHGGWNVKCSRLYGPSLALVGDAAHSVWPALGQGCNAALDSVFVLYQALEKSGCLGTGYKTGRAELRSKLQAGVKAYSKQHLPSAHAVVTLTAEAFGNGDRTMSRFGVAKTAALMTAHKLKLIDKPYVLLFEEATYEEVLGRKRKHEALLRRAGWLVSGAVVFTSAWRFGPHLLS